MRKRCTAQKNVKKECKFTRMGDTALSTCARKFIPAAVTVHKDRREGQAIGLLQQVPTTSLRGLYKATLGWLFFVPNQVLALAESAQAATKSIALYPE
jgi:hypothetical protein